jgi:hypothetical protein
MLEVLLDLPYQGTFEESLVFIDKLLPGDDLIKQHCHL